MDLLLSVIFAWIATIAVVLLSVIYILRKLAGKKKDSLMYKVNRALRKQHKTLGIIAIVTGLTHGLYSSLPILSANKGSMAFILIILLGLSFMFRKKLKGKWAKSHRVLAGLTCLLLVLHVIEVGGFVGIDGLANALDNDTSVDSAVVYASNDSSESTSNSRTDVVTEQVVSDTNNNILFDGLLLADGSYYGSADGFGPNLQTEVIVENGLVTQVSVIDHNEKNASIYGKAMDTIPLAIVDQESLQVDSVSGATYTSYGIMMSVENALEDALIEGDLPGIEMPSIRRGH